MGAPADQDKVEQQQQRFEMTDHFDEKNEEKINNKNFDNNSEKEQEYHPGGSNQNTGEPQDYSLAATTETEIVHEGKSPNAYDNSTTTSSNEIIPQSQDNNFSIITPT